MPRVLSRVLTDLKVRALKPRAKPYKVRDGEGLLLKVAPSGSRYWIFEFQHGGKKRELHLGKYPLTSLAVAREKAQEARAQVLEGLDPREEKASAKARRAAEEAETFERAAWEWWGTQEGRVAPSTAKQQRRRLEVDVLPLVGALKLKELTAPGLVRALEPLGKRGAETLKRAAVIVRAVCQWAVLRGLLTADPSSVLSKAFPAPKVEHRRAPVEPRVVGSILRALDAMEALGGGVAQCAARLLPLVVCRPGELRAARWEDFNLDEAIWRYRVPKTNTDHFVPLSRQALAILEEARLWSGGSGWVFPQERNRARPMSDGTLAALYSRAGVASLIVPHGWRAVFRTLGAERLGIPDLVLEAQLAHSVPDALGRAYNRTTWAEQRREALQRWADYLDDLKRAPAL